MLSTEPSLKSLQLTLSNDSRILLGSSSTYPPILQNCTYSGTSGDFWLEKGRITVKVECEDTAHGASAFLTYFVGGFEKKLVLWLGMKCDGGANIRFGIFGEDVKLDQDVLMRLSQNEKELEIVGFGKEFHGQLNDSEGCMHEIDMSLNIVFTNHQSNAQLNIRERPESMADVSQPIRVLYKLTGTVVGTLVFDPVHENIAISSLISAEVDGFDKGTTYIGILGRGTDVIAPASWEFIRGVLWNDDPACDFFNDYYSSNGDFQAWGGFWYNNFKTPGTITYRSHHGDLQFLHAMASTVGEKPEETQRKVLLWLEVMYRLSVEDGIKEGDRIDSTGLQEFFNDTTTPKGSGTLRDLLVGTIPKARDTDIKRRALGSCFHVIQDSYAVGHCQRELANPQDMVDVEYTNLPFYQKWAPWKERIYIKGFPKENPGRFADIKTFHCYEGQDDDRHGYYDAIPNGETLDPSDPSSFYCLAGATDALESCIALAQAWKGKWPWKVGDTEDGVQKMMKATFRLTSDATPSDTKVDEYLWGLKKPAED